MRRGTKRSVLERVGSLFRTRTIVFLKSQVRSAAVPPRRGSTLVIVIALLGLLAFTGMVFFTFASPGPAAAGYFSEAAKDNSHEPDDIWPHMLEHVLAGPSERHHIFVSVYWAGVRRNDLTKRGELTVDQP